jgi:hypothetical protein
MKRSYGTSTANVIGLAMAVAILLLLTKNPADRIGVDPSGAYVEVRDWWGLSRQTLPLRRAGGGWEVFEHGRWWPYGEDDAAGEVEPEPGAARYVR